MRNILLKYVGMYVVFACTLNARMANIAMKWNFFIYCLLLFVVCL